MADLRKALPKTWGSPTMSPHCDDEKKYGVVDAVVKHFEDVKAKGDKVAGQPIRDLVTVNGVRVTVEDGTWGLVRASSNKPELVVVVESPVSEARMRDMFKAVDGVLRRTRKSANTIRRFKPERHRFRARDVRSDETERSMRIAILGAGPAGLYLAYLLKRRRPDADITVVEQNPAGATFGFGVVFSDRALEFLREDDPETFAAITPQMESWNDITLVHQERARRDRRHRLCRHRAAEAAAIAARARALGRHRAAIRARGDVARRIRRRRSGGRRRWRQFAGAAHVCR